MSPDPGLVGLDPLDDDVQVLTGVEGLDGFTEPRGDLPGLPLGRSMGQMTYDIEEARKRVARVPAITGLMQMTSD